MHNDSQMGDQLFKDKYRIKSIRLPDWNYGSDGAYFITICVKNRKCVFGEIINGKMGLSKIGGMVQKYWCEIPHHFENIQLDEFIIMPNHVHGIVIIGDSRCRDAINRVSTNEINNCERNIGGITKHHNPMLSKSLSTIVRWYKGRCKFEINKIQNKIFFQWQPRFQERIIRNDRELNNKRQYIINNALQWESDKNNPKNTIHPHKTINLQLSVERFIPILWNNACVQYNKLNTL